MKEERRKYYSYWASLRGNPILVKPVKYLGLRGYNGYIQTKECDGILYAGEVWESETEDGRRIRSVFRIPYDEIRERKHYQERGLKPNDPEMEDGANAHFDGLEAYLTGRIENANRLLLTNRIIILNNRIAHLKDMFSLIDDPLLKLGIQLYLRRLENPNHYTSKDWKAYCKKNPETQSLIVDISNETSMGV